MGKLDEVKRAATLGARPSAFPPGMDPSQAVGRPARLEGVRGDRSSAWIAVDRIERDPDQPREEFDEDALARLAESLKTRGQLQPIRVRWDEGRGVYVILAGERRWRAARMAGLAELQCVIHDAALTADERLALQLVENALRDDLKPVEQARAYKRLMEAKGWTMTELAAELGVHQTSVGRALALLELPCTVQEQVEQGALAPSTRRRDRQARRPRGAAGRRRGGHRLRAETGGGRRGSPGRPGEAPGPELVRAGDARPGRRHDGHGPLAKGDRRDGGPAPQEGPQDAPGPRTDRAGRIAVEAQRL